MKRAAARPLGWAWTVKCRSLGGNPTQELFQEAVQAGDAAVPLLVDIVSRREWREGEPSDLAQLSLHAVRLLGCIGSPAAIPALLDVLLDPVDAATYQEEAAAALARIGEPAWAPVEGILKDPENGRWPRVECARTACFMALADRRLRPRVRAAFERILLDPRESDTLVTSHVVLHACTLAMAVLMPAIDLAYRAGRADPDVITPDSAARQLHDAHQRPDRHVREQVRRDPVLDCQTHAALIERLAPHERARLEALWAAADRDAPDDFSPEPVPRVWDESQ